MLYQVPCHFFTLTWHCSPFKCTSCMTKRPEGSRPLPSAGSTWLLHLAGNQIKFNVTRHFQGRRAGGKWKDGPARLGNTADLHNVKAWNKILDDEVLIFGWKLIHGNLRRERNGKLLATGGQSCKIAGNVPWIGLYRFFYLLTTQYPLLT